MTTTPPPPPASRDDAERLTQIRYANELAWTCPPGHSEIKFLLRQLDAHDTSRDDWYRNCLTEQARAVAAERALSAANAEIERLRDCLDTLINRFLPGEHAFVKKWWCLDDDLASPTRS